MAEQNNEDLIEFWFDAICPWTWITSRWMAEVNELENLKVQWHPFSLKILNADNDEGSFKASHENGHRLGKLFSYVKQKYGNNKVSELYTRIGEKLFPEDRKDIDAIINEGLTEAGLNEKVAAESDSAEMEKLLDKSTKRALQLVGPGVGVPIVSINEKAFFGPVISPAPKGEEALQLWKSVSIAVKLSGFSELKRGRSGGLDFS